MEHESVGTRVRRLRVSAGLTQPELAQEITSVSHISLIEANKRRPSDEIAVKLAKKLGVSHEYLLKGPDSASNLKMRQDYQFAEIALQNGDGESAFEKLHALVAINDQHRDSEFDVRVRNLYAQSLARIGRPEDAKRVLREAIRRAKLAGLPLQAIEMTITLSWYERESGDLVTALELIEEAQQHVPTELRKSATYARLLSSAIAIYYLRGDYIRAGSLSNEAIEVFDDETSPIARASIYWNASLAADANHRPEEALLLAQRAAGLFSEADDCRAEGDMRVSIAWLLTRQTPPNVAEARRQLVQAKQLLEGPGIAIAWTYFYVESARVEWLDGNYETSLEISLKALEGMKSDDDLLQRAEAHLMAARSMISLGREVESSMHIDAARSNLSSMEPSRLNAMAWRELGDIYSALGYLTSAISAYQQALHDAGVPASPMAIQEVEREEADVFSSAAFNDLN